MHRWGYPAASEEDAPEAAAEPLSRPRRREKPHDEALWEAREAHQWALRAVHVLQSDIERLSHWVGDAQNPIPIVTVVAGHGVNPWIDVQDPQVDIN